MEKKFTISKQKKICYWYIFLKYIANWFIATHVHVNPTDVNMHLELTWFNIQEGHKLEVNELSPPILTSSKSSHSKTRHGPVRHSFQNTHLSPSLHYLLPASMLLLSPLMREQDHWWQHVSASVKCLIVLPQILLFLLHNLCLIHELVDQVQRNSSLHEFIEGESSWRTKIYSL